MSFACGVIWLKPSLVISQWSFKTTWWQAGSFNPGQKNPIGTSRDVFFCRDGHWYRVSDYAEKSQTGWLYSGSFQPHDDPVHILLHIFALWFEKTFLNDPDYIFRVVFSFQTCPGAFRKIIITQVWHLRKMDSIKTMGYGKWIYPVVLHFSF